MQHAMAAAMRTTYADFNYFAGAPAAKPYRLAYTPELGKVETNAVFKSYRMPVADMRGQAETPTLDREGFAIADTPSVVKNFGDEMTIKTAYYAQSEAIVMQATGAARVVAFDHAVRRAGSGARRSPATRVHNDDTDISGPERVRRLMGAEAEDLLRRRFAIVNLWRPIGRPVEDAPLAVATASSLESSAFVPLDLVYPDRIGETYLVAHAPEHDWRYLSRQAPDEAMLFKCYDSARDGRARFTAHSAFVDPGAPGNARPQESIEIRTLVFFDD